jgi:RNA-directed DNA polymerase
MAKGAAPDRPLVSTRYLGAVLGIAPEVLLDLAENVESIYKPFTLVQEKRGREKKRPIDNPVFPLKPVQTRIKVRLLDTISFPDFVCGGVRKRSTQANAKRHVRQREVVALDIKDFFRTVTNAQVAKIWCECFGASREVAWLLTRLTTYKGHLPQGAPTSTALANLVILPVMNELNVLCRLRGTNLTVYVDDITLSGRDAKSAISMVANALGRRGFKLAREKVKVMPAHVRQEVTGHTVNRRLSNGRERLKHARSVILHAIGPEGTERDRQRARGLLAHVRGTSPAQGRWLAKRFAEATATHQDPAAATASVAAVQNGHPS